MKRKLEWVWWTVVAKGYYHLGLVTHRYRGQLLLIPPPTPTAFQRSTSQHTVCNLSYPSPSRSRNEAPKRLLVLITHPTVQALLALIAPARSSLGILCAKEEGSQNIPNHHLLCHPIRPKHRWLRLHLPKYPL